MTTPLGPGPCFAAVIALQVRAASACTPCVEPWEPTARFVGLRHCLKPGAARWEGSIGFPGGKLELGETAAEAAVRELREETGLAPDRPLTFVGVFAEPVLDSALGNARDRFRQIAFFLGETAVESVAASATDGPEGRVIIERLACFLDPVASPYAAWNTRVFDWIRAGGRHKR